MFRTGGGRWAELFLIASLIGCHSEAGTKIPPAARTESFRGSKAGDEREVAGIKLCWCPAGRFLMGSPPGEPERRPGEDQAGIASGFTMIFTTAAAVLNYQPSTRAPAALSADLVNPTSSSSGVFGGFVLALEFDVRFADAGKLPNSSGLRFGDLRLCGLTTTPQYNGLTLREFLDEMNYALGGGSIPCEDGLCYDNLAALTSDVTTAFEGGAPSLFAQEHLFSGPTCPCTPGAPGCGWEAGDVVGYPQASWGDPGNTAGILLTDHFDSVYAATGFLEVGIAGAAGFSIIFTSASAVLAYQPSVGTVGPLNADLVDPTASASGAFGGEVVALKLNIDFADAGHTGGSAPVHFGDILLCDTALPTLHGSDLRALLTMANTALGGGGRRRIRSSTFTWCSSRSTRHSR